MDKSTLGPRPIVCVGCGGVTHSRLPTGRNLFRDDKSVCTCAPVNKRLDQRYWKLRDEDPVNEYDSMSEAFYSAFHNPGRSLEQRIQTILKAIEGLM